MTAPAGGTQPSQDQQRLLEQQELRQAQNQAFQAAMSELQDKKATMDMFFSMKSKMTEATKNSIDQMINAMK